MSAPLHSEPLQGENPLLARYHCKVEDLRRARRSCSESTHIELRNKEAILSCFHSSNWNDLIESRAQLFRLERHHRLFMRSRGHAGHTELADDGLPARLGDIEF